MLRKAAAFVGRFVDLYTENRLVMASAALSYNLTMTFFPLVIVLHTLLGNNYDAAMRILEFTKDLMSEQTQGILRAFLVYVAENNSGAMMIAGITVLVTSASAGMRTMHFTVGRMQGGMRFKGLPLIVFSVLYSVLVTACVYLGMTILVLGEEVLERLQTILPALDVGSAWHIVRFVLLGVIEFALFWATYALLRRKEDRYPVLAGAAAATAAMVVLSLVFSLVISASVRYSLVYGSLASLILLMLWLYFGALILLCGAALNICIRDGKKAEGRP